MSADAAEDAIVPIDDFNSIDSEAGSSKVPTIECLSSNGEVMGEVGSSSEVLTRIELDLVCSSEKLVNLHILMMNVATMESEFESFTSEKENISDAFVDKAVEFGLLSGIFDSEVTELDNIVANLNSQIVDARELLSSCENLPETYVQMEEKLHDSEKSLQQSQDQVSEMKIQSAKFQRTLSCFGGEPDWSSDKGAESVESGKVLDMNAKINMQTVEQQRHILRMLEKSLAREIDLEKALSESRQIEDELRVRLYASEQEVFCMEEEATDVLERLLEADNAAEVFMGVSKELLGRLQILQFNLNISIQREDEVRSKLETSTQQINSLKASLREVEDKLNLANSEKFISMEKIGSLEKQLKESEFMPSKISEMESVIEDLKTENSRAESSVESAEAKFKLLETTNMELNEELDLLKGSGGTSEKVDLLESQLRESDIRLQHAVASAEASREKENMLNTTIQDMENLIENLKSKVSKAENRADSAEDKCIILSENNAELNEELCFLRSRMECLETSRHQAEDTKVTTAMDIGIRTKVIANLVMQLAIERERLHKQISSLVQENKILAVKLKQTNQDSSGTRSLGSNGNNKEVLSPKDELLTTTTTGAKESEEEVTESSATSFEVDNVKKVSVDEAEVGPGHADFTSELETVRRIDAGVLNFKHVFIAVLILVISAAAYKFQQHNNLF